MSLRTPFTLLATAAVHLYLLLLMRRPDLGSQAPRPRTRASRRNGRSIVAQLDADPGPDVRRWWEAGALDIAAGRTTVADAFAQVMLELAAFVMRRIEDPKTPPEVIDAYAMRFLPQCAVILRGKAGGGSSEAHEIPGEETSLDDLKAAYAITPRKLN